MRNNFPDRSVPRLWLARGGLSGLLKEIGIILLICPCNFPSTYETLIHALEKNAHVNNYAKLDAWMATDK